MPRLGLIVVKGYAATGTLSIVAAEKNDDFPTFGLPTIPTRRPKFLTPSTVLFHLPNTDFDLKKNTEPAHVTRKPPYSLNALSMRAPEAYPVDEPDRQAQSLKNC